MQALGNDFVLIDDRSLCNSSKKGKSKKISQLSKILCDRRLGIGADQLLLLCPSRKADFKMRIFNADGTEVEMCGNGIRCLGKYIWDKTLKTQNSKFKIQKLTIETLAGIIHIKKSGLLIKVDMGEPILEPEKIPVSSLVTARLSSPKSRHSSLAIDYPLKIKGKTFKITCVSMGNPHAVIFVKNVKTIPLSYYGPIIENHKLFPKRTNVEFIQILNRKNIKMRVWERGVGETTACGTGASASGVASALLRLTDRKVTVHLPGGKLLIEWSVKDNHVYLTGPAVKVFEGTIEIYGKGSRIQGLEGSSNIVMSNA